MLVNFLGMPGPAYRECQERTEKEKRELARTLEPINNVMTDFFFSQLGKLLRAKLKRPTIASR